MNLLEYISQDIKLLEKRETPKGTEQDVEVIWQRAGVINNNQRRYRKELLEREIERIQAEIDSGKTVWGCGFHPANGIGLPQDISHHWKRIWMENDGTCKGVLTLVPTKVGSDIQALIHHGNLGMSSRGFGSTTQRTVVVDGKRETYNDVNDDFKMVTPGDWVVGPSVSGAGNITEEIQGLESKLNGEKKEGKMKKNLDEELIKRVYQASGEKIPFALYKKKYGTVIQATALVEDGKYETMEQALRSLGESEARIQVLMRQLSPRRKCTLHEVAYEALACGVSPAVYAAKLNEQIERENTEEEGFPFTRQITANVLAEASRAGIDITDAEQRRRYLEIYQKQRQETEAAEARQVEEEENLTDEAMAEREKAMKEKLKKDLAAQVVKEAMVAGGADPEVVKHLVQEAWKKLDEKEV